MGIPTDRELAQYCSLSYTYADISDEYTSTELIVFEDSNTFVFRGTSSLRDWVTNSLNLRLFNRHSLGTQLALASVWKEAIARVDPNRTINITGHSLGGQLAKMFYLKLDPRLDKNLVTFGAPSIGNESKDLFPGARFYANWFDPVTYWPPFWTNITNNRFFRLWKPHHTDTYIKHAKD